MRFLPALNIALAESTWVYIHVCIPVGDRGREREREKDRERERRKSVKEVGQRQMHVLDAVI